MGFPSARVTTTNSAAIIARNWFDRVKRSISLCAQALLPGHEAGNYEWNRLRAG